MEKLKKVRPQMKISILSHGFSSWGGGIDFIRLIASSIVLAEKSTSFQHNLLLPKDIPTDRVKHYFRTLKKLITSFSASNNSIANIKFNENYLRNTFNDLKNEICITLSGSTLQSQIETAKKVGTSVILPCLAPIENSDIAWVGYLYDFQHRRLPNFFSDAAITKRDLDFQKMLFNAKHVIVNSKSVAEDAKFYFGAFPATLHALPFSPCPQLNWLKDDLEVTKRYQISKPYFIVSNQFWKHKDHTTAILAFSEFMKYGGDALLIFTGDTKDYRFPEYFDELDSLIHKLNIDAHIKILGHISKIDQINLVKRAIALIQPTLFEGGPGGGAVSDAIALGVPAIVSNIPVNMEIDCGDVTYFEASNPSDLAVKMLAQLDIAHFPKDIAKLMQQGLERRFLCGETIINIAHKAYLDFAGEHK